MFLSLTPSNPSTYKHGSSIKGTFALAYSNSVRIADGTASAIASACGAKVSFNGGTLICASYDRRKHQFSFTAKIPRTLVSPPDYTLAERVYSGATLVNENLITIHVT